MRHRKGFNHLGRTSSHRKAMLANMATSLIMHKRITTTTAKAKALRSYVEPLITKSKDDTTHSRRVVFSYLRNKYAVTELFREISPKVEERPGGYTRILKIGNRPGDNADMCIIELVDYNENMLDDSQKKGKTSRRRRGAGKKKDETVKAEAVKAPAADVQVAEAPGEVAPETEVVSTEETAVAEALVAEEPEVAEAVADEEPVVAEAETEVEASEDEADNKKDEESAK